MFLLKPQLQEVNDYVEIIEKSFQSYSYTEKKKWEGKKKRIPKVQNQQGKKV